MEILKYEFIEAHPTSFNGLLKELVKQVRHCRTNLTIDEFREIIPSLKSLEAEIQQFDATILNEHREYITEIMQALEEESEIQNLFIEDFINSSNAIINSFESYNFDTSDISFFFRKSDSYLWLDFYDYNRNRLTEKMIKIIKQTLKFSCNKYNIIMIDSTK
jgi:hypothetical protein